MSKICAWLDPEHEAFLRRECLVHWHGRWMTVQAYLDDQQFAMVMDLRDGRADPESA